MDEHEVEVLEADVRGSLATLDELRVPALASVRSRQSTSSRPLRALGVLATAALVVVLAVMTGGRLNAWRTERIAAATAGAAAVTPAAVTPAAVTPAPTSPPLRFEYLNAGPHALHQQIRDIAAADADAQHLWALVFTGSSDAYGRSTAVMRSDDGGANWTAVTNLMARPDHIAALGSLVLVSDLGADTAMNGASLSGGLFLSTNAGASWKRVAGEGVSQVKAFRYQGRTLFLAEHWWATNGAATGPSRIFASTDGETWREIGQVPGPVTSFGLLDVPLVVYSKNTPGDGLYRVEGPDFASLRLLPIAGSSHADGVLTTTPSGELWSFLANGTSSPLRSVDGGKTWKSATTGLSGRIAGLFVWRGTLYALGDGVYEWAASRWVVANVLVAKATAIFQLGDWVFVQQGSDPPWRSPG